jgi:hypothetical protein
VSSEQGDPRAVPGAQEPILWLWISGKNKAQKKLNNSPHMSHLPEWQSSQGASWSKEKLKTPLLS